MTDVSIVNAQEIEEMIKICHPQILMPNFAKCKIDGQYSEEKISSFFQASRSLNFQQLSLVFSSPCSIQSIQIGSWSFYIPKEILFVFYSEDGKIEKFSGMVSQTPSQAFSFSFGVKNILKCEIEYVSSWNSIGAKKGGMIRAISILVEEDLVALSIASIEKERQSRDLRATNAVFFSNSDPKGFPFHSFSHLHAFGSWNAVSGSFFGSLGPSNFHQCLYAKEWVSFYSISVPLAFPQHISAVQICVRDDKTSPRDLDIVFHTADGLCIKREYLVPNQSGFAWYSLPVSIDSVTRCELICAESWGKAKWCTIYGIQFITSEESLKDAMKCRSLRAIEVESESLSSERIDSIPQAKLTKDISGVFTSKDKLDHELEFSLHIPFLSTRMDFLSIHIPLTFPQDIEFVLLTWSEEATDSYSPHINSPVSIDLFIRTSEGLDVKLEFNISHSSVEEEYDELYQFQYYSPTSCVCCTLPVQIKDVVLIEIISLGSRIGSRSSLVDKLIIASDPTRSKVVESRYVTKKRQVIRRKRMELERLEKQFHEIWDKKSGG
ncbi:hypothetical protein ADUPG1_011768 [Aduncisulcus paluster]|uniref:Uncharacterized protein n=1 Tax=Aduncisulcus paluster TaxID=2918883 RepID=A0ABQ5JXW8_9EUKA|nr:hypothetical protein ADUPG1_011768 [Aduncisulcus paluster]